MASEWHVYEKFGRKHFFQHFMAMFLLHLAEILFLFITTKLIYYRNEKKIDKINLMVVRLSILRPQFQFDTVQEVFVCGVSVEFENRWINP